MAKIATTKTENTMNNSRPYDKCHDCGGDMTAAMSQPSELTIMDGDEIKEVYVSCDACGCRAGHRDYNPENHKDCA